MYKSVIKHHGPLNQRYLRRFEETIKRSLREHPRTSAFRCDLRFPSEARNPCLDMPTYFIDTDPAVITRFFASLDAKVEAVLNRRRKIGKRTHACTIRNIWVKEYSERHQEHYHVLLLLNKDVYHALGDYSYDPSNSDLAAMIRAAWCSALRADPERFWTLAHFPESPTYYLDRNAHPDKLSQAWDALFYRVSYFAKADTKQYGNGSRSFGCSQK
ncbi:uncharacterized protein DUF3296 [Halomonas alkaliantarctica]|nr:uncharacterized protein DUF3296 [Halomonas alkaliantarctica]|tara:strand:+ start:1454 stop:2098 length:645 start_codon:yes stop_codon:yes gene_type:complete